MIVLRTAIWSLIVSLILSHHVCLHFWPFRRIGMHFAETPSQKLSINLRVSLSTTTWSINLIRVNLLTHTVEVSETLCQFTWHLLVQVLMALTCLFKSIIDKLLRWVLVDVVLQPGQVKSVQTESNQVEQRLDVVDRSRLGVDLKLSYGSKHGIPFELGDFPFVLWIYTLRKCEINQIVPALRKTNVVQLQVPVTKTDLVK